jgi:hypothetical protein
LLLSLSYDSDYISGIAKLRELNELFFFLIVVPSSHNRYGKNSQKDGCSLNPSNCSVLFLKDQANDHLNKGRDNENL